MRKHEIDNSVFVAQHNKRKLGFVDMPDSQPLRLLLVSLALTSSVNSDLS